MKEIHFCEVCGCSYATEAHHIVYRSSVPALSNCKENIAYLCVKHHRDSKVGVHFNKELDIKLKKKFQQYLEESFNLYRYGIVEIQEILNISVSDTIKLSKHLIARNGFYYREDIIRVCMGGKLYEI